MSASHSRAFGSSDERDLALLQELLQPPRLDIDDAAHVLALQSVEQNDLVDPIEEFRTEARTHLRHHQVAHLVGVLAVGLRHQILGAEIRGHHDERVAEVDGAALAVGQPAVVEHLQQHVEDVRVGLLDLVEQHDLIGPPPHGLRERAAFLVTDVAGRRADQPRHRMLLHVLRHVDANERVLVVEQELGQGLGQLGLADPRGPQEHERANGPVRVLQARARPTNGSRDRLDGFGLPDHAFLDLLLHAQQLFALAFEHAIDRNAGPARDDLRDVIGGHRLVDHGARAPAPRPSPASMVLSRFSISGMRP